MYPHLIRVPNAVYVLSDKLSVCKQVLCKQFLFPKSMSLYNALLPISAKREFDLDTIMIQCLLRHMVNAFFIRHFEIQIPAVTVCTYNILCVLTLSISFNQSYLVWTDGHYLYGNLFFGMILKGIPPQKHYISCSMSYILIQLSSMHFLFQW